MMKLKGQNKIKALKKKYIKEETQKSQNNQHELLYLELFQYI